MPSNRRTFLASAVVLASGVFAAACAPYPDASIDPSVAYAVKQAKAARPAVTFPALSSSPVVTAAVASPSTMTMMELQGTPVATNSGSSSPAGTPTPHQAMDPSLPPIAAGLTKEITFKTIDRNVEIAPKVTLAAWTFDGRIPGPFIRVRQGDNVKFTLTNASSMPHSIDFHSARTAPNVDYKSIAPGESYTFTWTAADPGVFLYHCGTAPMLQHLAEGMYGGVAVDAVSTPLPKVDREFAFVQGEYYLTAPDANGVVRADLQKANGGVPDEVVFNGYVNQYMTQPIPVKVGEKIRVYLVNAGPNHFSAFHVVGTLFDHVWVDGNATNDLKGVQTWTVAPGEGSAFDFVLSKPGNYSMVTHSFADAGKGAMAVFKAE